jgi:predicted TIM-barrel fold metal-dependent hydrolase
VAGVDVTNTIHDALSEIDEFVSEKGLKGVYIEPQRSMLHPDDPSIFPIYERCIALDVAVTIMTGPFAGPDISFSNPASIDSVATRYPTLKIIAAHGCWPFVTEILGVAFKHENVYVCPDTYHFVAGSQPYIEAANGFMAAQLLFGTAYPARRLKQTVEDFKALGLEQASLKMALGDNARRLLGL